METQQRKRHVSEIKQVEVVNIASPTMRSTSREISSGLTTVRTSSINKRKLHTTLKEIKEGGRIQVNH